MSFWEHIRKTYFKSVEEKEQASNALKLFKAIKESVVTLDDSKLNAFVEAAEKAHSKYVKTGQVVVAAKVRWLVELVEKERQLLKMGFNKCVFRDDISKFAEEHKSRVIHLCNLEDYPREVPDEIVEKIEKARPLFDVLVVLYTDHTKREARKVTRVKDPILFGLFLDEIVVDKDKKGNDVKSNVMSDRMYFIADWVDEKCDLTWNTLVSEGVFNDTQLKATGGFLQRLKGVLENTKL